jgi:single-stranded DNA-binding protein
MENNKVILKGMVIKVKTNEKTGTVSFVMSTLNASAQANYPEIFVSRKKAEDVLKLKRGDRVTVEGYISTKKYKRTEEDGTVKSNFRQVVVANEITETKKELEEYGINEGKYEHPENRVYLHGTVRYINKSDSDLVTIILNAPTPANPNFINSVKTIYFVPKSRVGEVMAELTPGAEAFITATYQTSLKENKEGQKVKYDNIVVDSLYVKETGEVPETFKTDNLALDEKESVQETEVAEPEDVEEEKFQEPENVDANDFSENDDASEQSGAIHLFQ